MASLARASLFALALAVPASSHAQTVVTFDVDPADQQAMSRTMRTGGVFGGIQWDGRSGWSAGSFNAPGLRNTVQCHSAPYCASPNGMNVDGSTFGAFGFAAPVRFFGLYLSGPMYTDATPIDAIGTDRTQVAAQLWRGGTLVFTTPYLDVAPTPTWLDVRYAGAVDAVRLVGDPAFTAIDDVTYATTPEPASLVLAATGLTLLGAVARRRRR